MRSLSLGFLLALCSLSCSDDDPVVAWVVPDDPTAFVLQNMATVKQAGLDFAKANGGAAAADVDTDTTPDGKTLIDFLPGGRRLINPYTGERSEPQAPGPFEPGTVTVTYEPGFLPTQFHIYAYDIAGGLDYVDNSPELEAATIELRDVIDASVRLSLGFDDGIWNYPSTVAELMQFLPEAKLARNPFTLLDSEPIDGGANTPGQIGYSPVQSPSGFRVGYRVWAWGTTSELPLVGFPDEDEFISLLDVANLVLQAARAFAAENDGKFPLNVGSDQTPLGNTLLDLLGGSLLENPYTEAATEPRDGAATQPGQVGYEPKLFAGIPADCVITAYGADGMLATLPIR